MTPAAGSPDEPVARTFVSQGLRLSYLDWGSVDAPLVLLLHGVRDHARSWDWTARALAADGWRVVAPDLRGHGASDWSPDGAYLSSYQLQDLADLIDHLAVPQLSIVGHSFGGDIAGRYAAMFPERVGKLVLVDGMGPGPEVFEKWERQGCVARSREWLERRRGLAAKPPPCFRTVEEATERFSAAQPHLSLEQAKHLARHGLRQVPDGGWTWKADPLMSAYPPEDYYAETSDVWRNIACPTLIFWAAKSFTVNPIADGRTDLIRSSRTVVYENAGHWLHHERFDDFLAELRAFL
jgi:pimeloyl-ACP methyl ester carboxylesterase